MTNILESDINKISRKLALKRITALWALSEGMLGGILHALHIPFSGIILGGSAVIYISLITFFSESKVSILRATIIVLIVKGIVSPHTPPAAYFSVFLQGALGQLLFRNKKHLTFSAFVLSVTTFIYFSLQKLIIYTVVFGYAFWESIDVYTNYLVDKFFYDGAVFTNINFSLIIISIYVSVYLVSGILIGILAGKIIKWFNKNLPKFESVFLDLTFDTRTNSMELEKNKHPGRKRNKRIIYLLCAATLIIITYLTPDLEAGQAGKLTVMFLRAAIIIFIWYMVISPILMNKLKRYLNKRQNEYASEIAEIMNYLPHLKVVVLQNWNSSSRFKGIKKYKYFLSNSLLSLLLAKFNFD